MFERRKEIINWINNVELNYECHNLKCKDLHLWPVLRWVLFKDFMADSNNGERKIKKKKSSWKQLNRKSRNIFQYIFGGISYLRLMLNLVGKIEVIFAGSHTHRINYNKLFINRYFYPLIIYCQKHNLKFLLADYSRKSVKNYSFPDNHFPIVSSFYFLKKFSNPSRIIKDLDENIVLNKILNSYNSHFNTSFNKTKFFNSVYSILIWAKVYEKLISACKANLAFELCYYQEAMFGLSLAAYRKGIKSVEIQHGTQGELHVAYTGFKFLPEKGFSSLPRSFWVWDSNSYEHLSYIFNNKHHNVLLGGNPWISFLSSEIKKSDKENNEKILLFTLQPIPPFIPQIVIDAIASTPSGYKWWFRMHPRMRDEDFDSVISLVRKNKFRAEINFNEATNLPLPIVLNKSFVHISRFSGCIIEAHLLGVPNVIIDKIGVEIFQELLQNEVGNFEKIEGDLWPIIKSLAGRKHMKENVSIDPVMDKLTLVKKTT